MSFSRRQGIVVAKTLQLNSMDQDLRNGLWNVFDIFVGRTIDNEQWERQTTKQSPCRRMFGRLWMHLFKWPLDTMPRLANDALRDIRRWYFDNLVPWHRLYDFVEFVAENIESPEEFKEACNNFLEREVSAYRFIGDIIAPLTNAQEIEAIQAAASEVGPLTPVSTHIKTALELLANRTEPDFRNSMKDSISAVESVVKIITGDAIGTLGKMLDKIGPQLNLHPSLVAGFKSLYGYTSDDQGIRHALKDDRTPELEDARYFLVTCSAFTNYLIEKARKLKII